MTIIVLLFLAACACEQNLMDSKKRNTQRKKQNETGASRKSNQERKRKNARNVASQRMTVVKNGWMMERVVMISDFEEIVKIMLQRVREKKRESPSVISGMVC
jgi:outer membrane lipoprotein-sorting protein